MKNPNIGDVMNKFEVLGIVGEDKSELPPESRDHGPESTMKPTRPCAADGADCAVSHLVFLCAGSTPHCSLPSTSEWCDAAFGFLRGENWSTALSHRQKYQA
ncbi:hypothetical protein D4764_07G0002580 [Takifugu flavidus]|uniref:Uncharacterized protein n=1 Tax=Takifugu flavidus TaxID=433684 RepID=A0A5C6MRX1_9TELE|nr:hypothetical protein D4764_07G0002580 [Takifugu flavidus]